MNDLSIQEKPVVERAVDVDLIALGTALPPLKLSQKEALKFILDHFPIVSDRTRALYRKVMENKSVQFRFFAMDNPLEVLEPNLDAVNERFQRKAAALSAQSLKKALDQSTLSPKTIDFLAVTTCTGYLCPGLSSYVIESCGLREDVHTIDIVGMGCGAALPAMRQAFHFVQSQPGAVAAVVSTEVCSAAMFSNDSPDIVISNALFGDGSAALLLKSRSRNANSSNGSAGFAKIHRFASLSVPEWRDGIRFRSEDGRLRNVLSKEVPEFAASGTSRVVSRLLAGANLRHNDIRHWILHPGGERILDSLQTSLNLSSEDLASSRAVLREAGNLSSPSVLFVLQEELSRKNRRSREWGVMATFGAGFSAYAALLEFTP